MRLLTLIPPLFLAAVGANAESVKAKAEVKDASTGPPASGPVKTDGGGGLPTTFNGQPVPEIKSIEAEGKNFEDAIKLGYWLTEFFSPYCHHCKAFAPILQTAYELYYTSNTAARSANADDTSPETSLNSFTRYYNFHFAKVDCVAYGDTCSEQDIQSFPSLVLYKDGKEIKRNKGYMDLKATSEFLEEILESIKPGSRPKEGLELPEVGADHSPDYKSSSPASGSSSKTDKSPGAAAKVADNVKEKLGSGAGKAAKAFGDLAGDTVAKVRTKAKSIKTTKTTASPRPTQNPLGKSIALTAANFNEFVTQTRDPWFIKFYAPWCHHCQAMAPTWAAMAKDMKNKLNIAEVNCDVERRLCKDAKVRGYPTLALLQGGERLEYHGLRGLGDLISFAEKVVDANDGIEDVNAAAFEELEKTEEVIFLYVYDHAATSEDFAALERLQLPLIGHAKLVKTKDPLLYKRYKVSTWPRLLVSRDGKPSYFTALAPKDIRDHDKVLGWMRRVWQPLVPELTASNAREIMNNKFVVLGILSRDRADEFIIAKREIKNAAIEWIEKQTQAFQLERQELRDAKQLRIEEAEDRNDQRALRAAKSIRIDMDDMRRKEVAFAWVDGIFWERWIKTTFGIQVRDGERVVVNDESNHRFWDTTITGNPIVPSRTSILETLGKIVSNPPKITPKSTTLLRHTLHLIPDLMSSHPYLTFLLVLTGSVIGFHMYTRRNGRNGWTWGNNTGGFFQLPLNNGGNEKGSIHGNGGALSSSGHGGVLGGGPGKGSTEGIISSLFGSSNAGKKD